MILTRSLDLENTRIVPEARLDEAEFWEHHLLFVSLPAEKHLPLKLHPGLIMKRGSFVIEGQTFAGSSDTFSGVFSQTAGRCLALFLPLSTASAQEVATKITHCGRYGYLAFTGDRMSEADFQRIYCENWIFAWSLYGEIFEYARKGNNPLVGLNMDFIRQTLGAHAHGHLSFANLCEAQLAWDKFMALNALGYLKTNERTRMVILAGIGHTWKKDIPDQFQHRTAMPFTVLLSQVPGTMKKGLISFADADYSMLGESQ